MAGYIGSKSVSLSTTAANVEDITATDTSPEVTLVNTTHEDTDGGREGKVIFKGQQSGGEESTLAEIQASHDGTADDEKGDLIFRTNDGSDGASPTERLRISSDSTFTFTSDDAGASLAPNLKMYRNSSSPADNDLLGNIEFEGRNDNSQDVVYGRLFSKISDASDGTEDGIMRFDIMKGGSLSDVLTFTPDELVVNDGSFDYDFRVESNDNANTIFVDASEPSVAFGLGTNDSTVARMAVGLTGAAISGDTDGATIGKGAIFRLVDDTNWSTTNSTIFLMGGGTGGAVGQISSAIGFARQSNTNWGTQLKFYTHPVGTSDLDDLDERMRIDAGGSVMIGTTSADDFSVAGHRFNVGTGAYSQFVRTGTDSTANMYIARASDGRVLSFYRNDSTLTQTGNIYVTSSATTYNTSSDYRLKENVTDVTDGITRVKQLSPKRFNFIIDPDKTVDGFLAHETATVVPEAITGTKDEVQVWEDGDELPEGVSVGDNKLDDDGNTIPVYQGIDQSKLVPLLTAALQEAIAKIEDLETRVAALEAE
jgi:hypothetical protein